jgi:hypothetical protein
VQLKKVVEQVGITTIPVLNLPAVEMRQWGNCHIGDIFHTSLLGPKATHPRFIGSQQALVYTLTSCLIFLSDILKLLVNSYRPWLIVLPFPQTCPQTTLAAPTVTPFLTIQVSQLSAPAARHSQVVLACPSHTGHHLRPTPIMILVQATTTTMSMRSSHSPKATTLLVDSILLPLREFPLQSLPFALSMADRVSQYP